MIRCPNCRTEAPPGSRFCAGCGQALYQPCPSCEQEIGTWMEFCPHCGSKADAEVAAPSGPGDFRIATVLFGDVKGFTAMSESLHPEEVTDIMNRCFEELSQPIVKYGGTIDKYVGDAIMARFGAPRAHEDDPVRAIHAALEMQRALTAYGEEVNRRTGHAMAMRIGINTGKVMAGEVGSSALKQFTLMGNTVNLASRLEHEAEPGKILVGESTFRLARHAFEFEATKPMAIRGQSKPVQAYVPLRPKAGVPAPRGRGEERKFRLVGRDTEIDLLATYMSEARAGEGRLVAIVGEPGVGKSRLAEEFWKQHQHEDLGRIYAAAPSFGETIPYSLLSGFVRSLLFGTDEAQEVQPEELMGAVRPLVPEDRVQDAVAVVADLLGLKGAEGTNLSKMEARSRQAMLTSILKIMLATRSMQKPILLVLDDMHWCDSASLAVFDQILSGIISLPIMALLMHRPVFTGSWNGLVFYRQINVREMQPQDARNLILEILGSLELPAIVGQTVIEKSGGNPFFLEQILNSLVESGAIEQRDGSWTLVHDISSITVPDTIHEILLARIDQLSRGARSVLEVAAVIGRVFAYSLLQAIVDAERNLDDYLGQLQRQQFIYEKTIVPELEYMFKHSLTQDVVYNGLLESQRRVFHERVAETIESLGGSTLGEQLPLLAFHYGKTEKWERALEYAIEAGARSRHLYANEDAIHFFRQALDLLEEHHIDDPPRKLRLLEALGDTCEQLARFDEARNLYDQARELCPSGPERARIHRKMGDLSLSRGHYADAMTYYREAEASLAGDPEANPTEQANVWLGRARMDRSRGALEPASRACLNALSVSGKIGEETLAALYYELGEIERERGRFRSASGYLEAAAGTWEGMGALDRQAMAIGALGDVAFNAGRLGQAYDYFQNALETQRRVADRHEVARAVFGIGRTQLAMGDLETAVDRYTEALSLATELDDRQLRANCTLYLGLVHLERRDAAHAESLLAECYSAFKHIRNWRGAAQSLLARAELLKIQGKVDSARTSLHRARNLTTEMNDSHLLAQVALSEADLEERSGRLDAAADRAAAAVGIARDLSDTRMIGRAEQVMGRIWARQGRIRAGLDLLAGSVRTLRESGARLEAARAALDYAVAAQDGPTRTVPVARDMLATALTTFEQGRLEAEAEKARSLSERFTVLDAEPRDPVPGPAGR